ncbi:MAG: flagellar basal body P-ring formation protein FlgA [SAR324 cluster bacterium]|nr:flagellar basal body P-ring formation protein FlgA [SAR324 cluster bacterium]
MSLIGKMILWTCWLGIFYFSIAIAAPSSQISNGFEPVQVSLSEESILDKSHYKLAEIAQLEGSDPLLLEKLANITIGRTPLPGGRLVATQSLIRSKLRPHIKSQYLHFTGAEKTIIRRSAFRVSGEEIDQSVLNHVYKELDGLDIKPKLLSKSRDIFLPKGTLEFKIKSRGKYKREGGYRTYEVAFSIDDKLIKKIPIRVYIKIYKEVYAAKDTIKRNHLIQENDLKKIRKNVDRLPSNYVTDKSILVGKIAKRAITSSEVLQNNTVTSPPIIKRGDHILIVYETPSLRLTAQGIAMQKGRLGDRIPVRNTVSKTLVQATVKNTNFVQVN